MAVLGTKTQTTDSGITILTTEIGITIKTKETGIKLRTMEEGTIIQGPRNLNKIILKILPKNI